MSWLSTLLVECRSLSLLLLLVGLAGLMVWRCQKKGEFLRRRARIARRLLVE